MTAGDTERVDDRLAGSTVAAPRHYARCPGTRTAPARCRPPTARVRHRWRKIVVAP